jgi:hypothetical protein
LNEGFLKKRVQEGFDLGRPKKIYLAAVPTTPFFVSTLLTHDFKTSIWTQLEVGGALGSRVATSHQVSRRDEHG